MNAMAAAAPLASGGGLFQSVVAVGLPGISGEGDCAHV